MEQLDKMNILIDADSLYFRTCMVTQKQSDVRKSIKMGLKEIETECGIFSEPHMKIAIKGKGNFRYDVSENYKGHRKELDEKIKKCLSYAHKHLQEQYDAVRCDGMEADDMVAIWAWECIRNKEPYVVVHIDKDLNMIPGAHYNFVKKEHYMVDFEEAHSNFLKQILTGDSADNIPGVHGIGPKKSEKLLEGLAFDQKWKKVREQWTDKKQMEVSARLLWMSTTQEEVDQANAQVMERLEALTLDEFWLGKQEVQDETNKKSCESETSECEQDVREEREDDVQDS